MSLEEGIVRDLFPKITKFLHSITNKKNTMLALEDYIKRVIKGDAPTMSLVQHIANVYKGVEYIELEELIVQLVKTGQLAPIFDPE